MALSKPLVSTSAAPRHNDLFDAWNSSATGHQTAENRLSSSAGWRRSRSMKLSDQLKSGPAGGKRNSDLVGARSEPWDEKAKVLLPRDMIAGAKISVADMVVSKRPHLARQGKVSGPQMRPPNASEGKTTVKPIISTAGIFTGLTIYINGSTSPLISDHKLKYLLAEHGAKISLHLGRRQVTHVILGNPCGRTGSEGSGGGLAASKIQRETRRTGGCGIRYVGAKWVLDSLKAGIRLPESRFSNLAVASKRQPSVYGCIFKSIISNSELVEESIDGI